MQKLFSYGTLQQVEVQISIFGRTLIGRADELVEFSQSFVKIEDPDVIATSGKSHHPIVRFTGVDSDRVAGTVFEISDLELANADKYEVSAYKRVAARLASGAQAWVYVDVRFAPKVS